MSIRPLVIGGMLQRTDDISALKQQQDNKPMVEQHNLQSQVAKREDKLSHQVMTSEDSAKSDTHADAREEGKNQYFFRKKAQKKSQEQPQDRVVKKTMGGGFDIKI